MFFLFFEIVSTRNWFGTILNTINWFFELLKDYKNEKITIGDILAEIHPIVFRFDKTYLASQTYFLLYANPEKGNIFKALK